MNRLSESDRIFIVEDRADEGLGRALAAAGLVGLMGLSGTAYGQTGDSANAPTVEQPARRTWERYGGFSPDQVVNVLTRTIFVEGRGETPEGRKMIATVIWNRAGGDSKNFAKTCLKPSQFSCWNKMTPSERTPDGFETRKSKGAENNAVWDECEKLAASMLDGTFKPLGRYNSYLNPKTAEDKSWMDGMSGTRQVGRHLFGYLPEHDGFKRTKMKESMKITMTFDQIKKLVNEAIDPDEKEMSGWKAAIVKAGSTEAGLREALRQIKAINDMREHDALGYEVNDILEVALALPSEQSGNDVEGREALEEVSEEGVDEAASVDSSNPMVYVGTYAKYNEGNIDGEWVDLTAFVNYDDFMEYIRELHSDEDDPEFMFQDYQNFPEAWYSESGLDEDTFEKIKEYAELSPEDREAYEAYVSDASDDDIERFRDAYVGHFATRADFAYEIVGNAGWEAVGRENLEDYFDYETYGRDLKMDYSSGDPTENDDEGNPQKPNHLYDTDGYDMGEDGDDAEFAENCIAKFGGIDGIDDETLHEYFDYDRFGRDLLLSDYWQNNRYYFRNL